MKKLPALLGAVRAHLTRPSDQDLIDATEDRMVNGPPLTEEQKKLRADMQAAFDIIDKQGLHPSRMLMNKNDYDDIVKWSGDSPPGEGPVE